MNPEELTDEEVLTAALLLGFEWHPLNLGAFRELDKWEGFGFFNHPHGNLLAIDRNTAARLYLEHTLPKKP